MIRETSPNCRITTFYLLRQKYKFYWICFLLSFSSNLTYLIRKDPASYGSAFCPSGMNESILFFQIFISHLYSNQLVWGPHDYHISYSFKLLQFKFPLGAVYKLRPTVRGRGISDLWHNVTGGPGVLKKCDVTKVKLLNYRVQKW